MSGPIRVAHITTVDLTLRYLLLAQLERLRDEGFEVTAISAPGEWCGELEGRGIRHIPWRNATRAWDPASDVRAFAELVGILRRERFDIVHTHNPKPGVLGRVAARVVGVPHVVNTVHGLYATPGDRLRRRLPVLAVERLAARMSDLELYQSEEDLTWARRIGLVTPEKSRLLGNGIDLSRFHPGAVPAERVRALRRELGIPEGSLVVGTVGRLVAEKGYRELAVAAARVCAAIPGVRFLAVGDADAQKADALSREELCAGMEDVFLCPGWRQDVQDLLAVMDVFVLASWREGLPRSAVEAAAMGKPMVLTDIRGCREVSRHEREALLVPPRDPDALTAAIVRLLGDPALRSALGSAARSRAVDRFDERRVADVVVGAYRELLARTGPEALPTAPVAGGGDAGGASPARGPAAPETAGPRQVRQAGGDLRIRPALPGDAGGMAALHRATIHEGFLPLLGDRFMRILYRALATAESSVAVVADRGGHVVGFATGVLSVKEFYRTFYRRYGPRAALAAASRLVRPAIFRKALETARYSGAVTGLPDSELLSIAVAPECRGSGAGRMLGEEVVAGLTRMGAGAVKVVVGAGNQAAGRLYARLGFAELGEIEVHAGTPSAVWVIHCSSS